MNPIQHIWQFYFFFSIFFARIITLCISVTIYLHLQFSLLHFLLAFFLFSGLFHLLFLHFQLRFYISLNILFQFLCCELVLIEFEGLSQLLIEFGGPNVLIEFGGLMLCLIDLCLMPVFITSGNLCLCCGMNILTLTLILESLMFILNFFLYCELRQLLRSSSLLIHHGCHSVDFVALSLLCLKILIMFFYLSSGL